MKAKEYFRQEYGGDHIQMVVEMKDYVSLYGLMDEFAQAEIASKPITYTPEEYLKAAEIGEVSMIDAKHVVSLLDEARAVLKKGFDCRQCKNSFSNPFDELFCELDYDLEKDEDCDGEYFERRGK
jgi:hypothetical protein